MDINTTEQIIESNTTFVNELESTSFTAKPAQKMARIKNRTAMESDFTDDQWTIEKMLGKPIKCATINWSTTDAEDSYLLLNGTFPLVIIPIDYLTAHLECMQTNLLKSYTFARYAVEFEVQINALKMHTGRALLGYIPITTTNAIPTNVSATRASMYPGIYIDAANANPVHLTVPWVHMQSAFNQTVNRWPNVGLGSLFLKVIAPLTATTNVSSTVELTIYMYLRNAQLRVPVNPALTFLTPVPPTVREHRYFLNETQGLFDDLGGFLKQVGEVAGGIYSGIENAVNLDFSEAAGDFGKAIQTGLTIVEDNPEIAALLLDRPMCLKSEVMSKNMTFSSFAYGIGSDTVTRLDITPFSMYVPNGDVFSGFANDHDLKSILMRPAIIARFDWASTTTTGSLLYSRTIAPLALDNGAGSDTWISYISDAFTYWNGSIVFHIDIVASQFHSGRLVIMYTPGVYAQPASLVEGTNWPMAVLDLANVSNHSYAFKCDYNAPTPYLKVRNGANRPDYTGIGRLLIYVQNALVHTDNVATQVRVIVSASAGEDFHLWGPRQPTLKDWPNETTVPAPSIGTPAMNQVQADEVDNEVEAKKLLKTAMNQLGNVKQIRAKLAASISDIDQWINLVAMNVEHARSLLEKVQLNEAQADDVNLKAEEIEEVDMIATPKIMAVKSHARFGASLDVRDIIRRYGGVYFGGTNVIVAQNTVNRGLVLPVRPRCNGSGDGSMLAYFSRMFALWSGSIRYKILFNNAQTAQMVAYVAHMPDYYVAGPIAYTPNAQFYGDASQYALKLTNLTNEHGFEVEVPYNCRFHCLTTGILGELETGQNGILLICFRNNAAPVLTGSFMMSVYHAAGDDFNFHFPVPPTPFDQFVDYTSVLESN
jgi:hypothetical protein